MQILRLINEGDLDYLGVWSDRFSFVSGLRCGHGLHRMACGRTWDVRQRCDSVLCATRVRWAAVW